MQGRKTPTLRPPHRQRVSKDIDVKAQHSELLALLDPSRRKLRKSDELHHVSSLIE